MEKRRGYRVYVTEQGDLGAPLVERFVEELPTADEARKLADELFFGGGVYAATVWRPEGDREYRIDAYRAGGGRI